MLVVTLAVLVAGLFSGSAAADTRCCKKVGGPPQLPATGLLLYVPVLLSLGLIGTGVVLRRRTRETV